MGAKYSINIVVMRLLVIWLLLLSVLHSVQANDYLFFDAEKEIQELAEEFTRLVEVNKEVEDEFTFSEIKRDLATLKRNYQALVDKLKKDDQLKDYEWSLNLLESSIYLLEMDIAHFKDYFAITKRTVLTQKFMSYELGVYRSASDKKTRNFERQLNNLYCNSNLSKKEQNAQIERLVFEKEQYLLHVKKGEFETSAVHLIINFHFEKIKVNKGSSTEIYWIITSVDLVSAGGKGALQTWVEGDVVNLIKDINSIASLSVLIKRTGSRKHKVDSRSLKLPFLIKVNPSGPNKISINYPEVNIEELKKFSYKKNLFLPRYFYWTDINEITSKFLDELEEEMK
jgi:hypothetical protein